MGVLVGHACQQVFQFVLRLGSGLDDDSTFRCCDDDVLLQVECGRLHDCAWQAQCRAIAPFANHSFHDILLLCIYIVDTPYSAHNTFFLSRNQSAKADSQDLRFIREA
jgi:hypothetical protein